MGSFRDFEQALDIIRTIDDDSIRGGALMNLLPIQFVNHPEKKEAYIREFKLGAFEVQMIEETISTMPKM